MQSSDDICDDPKPVRRVEVITSAAGRRRWSEEEKAQIVAESFAPGAVVAEVARRHDARAQQLHLWRRDAREGRLALPATAQAGELMSFAPVVMSAPPPRPSRSLRCAAPVIEIEAHGVIVRVRQGADAMMVEAVMRALRGRA